MAQDGVHMGHDTHAPPSREDDPPSPVHSMNSRMRSRLMRSHPYAAAHRPRRCRLQYGADSRVPVSFPSPIPGGAVIVGCTLVGLSTAVNMLRNGIRPVRVIDRIGHIADRLDDYSPPYGIHTPVSVDFTPGPDPGPGPMIHRVLFNRSMNPSIPADIHVPFMHAQQEPFVQDFVLPLGPHSVPDSIPAGSSGTAWIGINTAGAVIEEADAMRSLYRDILSLGGAFSFGETIESLRWENGRCLGAVTQEGRLYEADVVVVVCTGANIRDVLPPLRGQLQPVAQVYAYIKLTPFETQRLQHLPVPHGYLCAPHPEHEMIQVCASSIDWCFRDTDTGELCTHRWKVDLPPAAESKMRRLVEQLLPQPEEESDKCLPSYLKNPDLCQYMAQLAELQVQAALKSKSSWHLSPEDPWSFLSAEHLKDKSDESEYESESEDNDEDDYADDNEDDDESGYEYGSQCGFEDEPEPESDTEYEYEFEYEYEYEDEDEDEPCDEGWDCFLTEQYHQAADSWHSYDGDDDNSHAETSDEESVGDVEGEADGPPTKRRRL